VGRTDIEGGGKDSNEDPDYTASGEGARREEKMSRALREEKGEGIKRGGPTFGD